MYNLVKCYKNGEGTEKNLEKAFYWYQKTAENGNIDAMNSLAQSRFKSYIRSNFCKSCYHSRDYLNEFRICDSCCEEMNQKSPNEFKSNVKFEYCVRCYLRKNDLNEFNECKKC